MGMLNNVWTQIKRPFKWAGKKLAELSTKIGGPAEKRNLPGNLIDGVAWTVKLPFKVASATGKWLLFLGREPKPALQKLAFQIGRLVGAAGVLFSMASRDRDGRVKVNVDGIVAFFWLVVLWGTLLPIFAAFKLFWLQLAITAAVVVGYVVTQLPKAIVYYNEIRWEDFVVRHQTMKNQAVVETAARRERDTAEALKAAQQAHTVACDHAAIMEEQKIAARALAEAEKAFVAAKAAHTAAEARKVAEQAAKAIDLDVVEGVIIEEGTNA